MVCDEEMTTGRHVHCFASWRNVSGVVEVLSKGCWLDSEQCPDTSVCRTDYVDGDVFFCCCNGDFCNVNFTSSFLNVAARHWQPDDVNAIVATRGAELSWQQTCYALVPAFLLSLAIFISCWLYTRTSSSLLTSRADLNIGHHRKRRHSNDAWLTWLAERQLSVQVQLADVIGRGRYGEVWRGVTSDGQTVAVKVFSANHRQSWLRESYIYCLAGMQAHPNILRCVDMGVVYEEKYQDPPNPVPPSYWLVTSYHELGSLAHVLQQVTLSPSHVLIIARSFVAGLAYLHEPGVGCYKPPIAHRDIKASNVLLRPDFTACLADFDLAVAFTCDADGQLTANTLQEVYHQVGTIRYMAPEVLDGAMSFTCEAFLNVDMYAASLLLWQLLHRCHVTGNVGLYQLPFDEEMRSYPSHWVMRDVITDIVVRRRARPHVRVDWKTHSLLAAVVQSMEECWDEDPEARLSASCLLQRLESTCLLGNTGHHSHHSQSSNVQRTPSSSSTDLDIDQDDASYVC